jgi:hypothetical protein
MFTQVFASWYKMIGATFEIQQEVLQTWARSWPVATMHPDGVYKPQSKRAASTIPGFSGAELQDLKEAVAEYETTHGDWSKSR